MAVYTKLDKEKLNVILSNYNLGEIKKFSEIKEGTQLQIGAKVEVLDEARCLYILLKANDGRSLPYGNGYSITLNQIRLVETGEVGWTWSRSIEFDNK